MTTSGYPPQPGDGQPPNYGQQPPQYGPPPQPPQYGQAPQYGGPPPPGQAPDTYPSAPAYGSPPPPTPKKKMGLGKKVLIGAGVFVTLIILIALIGGGEKEKDTAAATSTSAATIASPSVAPKTTAASTSEAPAVKTLTMPGDLVGMNGKRAYDKLTKMGFTAVRAASADPSAAFGVVDMANWRVTSVEPGAGEKLQSDETVILTMTRLN